MSNAPNVDPNTGEINPIEGQVWTIRQHAAHSNASRSAELNELFAALSAAQGELRSAAKDGVNPHFQSAYTTLGALTEAVREPLAKHGLCYLALLSPAPQTVIMTMVLGHKSGQFISSTINMEPGKQTPQAMGSCITYARRYLLGALTGVPSADDDDGNEASAGSSEATGSSRSTGSSTRKPPQRKSTGSPTREEKDWSGAEWGDIKGLLHDRGGISEPQANRLKAIAKKGGWNLNDYQSLMKEYVGLERLSEIPWGDPYDALVAIAERGPGDPPPADLPEPLGEDEVPEEFRP